MNVGVTDTRVTNVESYIVDSKGSTLEFKSGEGALGM